ncbi:alkaline ceramidase 3 isoform X2 [Eurytemora carolleeae]|uniref:alkaline ceramidase 3 isoform X2 n=1 Tax=Eurytemora carolleeae TaxID=1294199 RepID=UPI000C77F210|nr:alkaline ceramidase 3 isoform X2 [Eurytemora carolleeae]|eukprot:XP_023346045.1 alkaline ceramidase 3-like isoform X2 [Eurytemora affinis]
MIIPAQYSVYQARKQGLEHRYVIVNYLFLLVGVGSWLFHMTLRWSMQLLDEIPMVWGTSYMNYCMHLVAFKPKEGSPKMAAALTLYNILFTLVYLIFRNPLIHESMYGLLVVVMVYQSFYYLKTQYTREGTLLYITGFVMYLTGFILWNIDNTSCASVISIRNSLPVILQPLLQLHAWWHILAGYATYLMILYSEHQRLTYLKREVTLSPSWCGLTVKHKRAGQMG